MSPTPPTVELSEGASEPGTNVPAVPAVPAGEESALLRMMREMQVTMGTMQREIADLRAGQVPPGLQAMPEMETAEMLSGADLYKLMLEAGVYSGESNKMRWEELGHSKKFEEKHRAKDLKDPAQLLSFVKAYGSWLSTFERPKKGQGSEERVSLADMLEDYTHCERVVRVFIANLPEGNDGLIKAVEGHYATAGLPKGHAGSVRYAFRVLQEHL